MNKKFTKLIAALALLVFMTPTMRAWADDVTATLTGESMVTGTSTSYTDYTSTGVTDDDNNVWYGRWCYQKQGSDMLPMIQLRTYSNSTDNGNCSRLNVPTFGGNIKTITLNITNGSATAYNTGTGTTTTLYLATAYSKTNVTAILTDASDTNRKTVTFDLTTLNDNYTGEGLYILANGGVRIWEVAVTYTIGGGSNPEIQIPAEQLSLSYEENLYGSFDVTYTNSFEPFTAFARLYTTPECNDGEEFPATGDEEWISLDEEDLSDLAAIAYMVETNTSTTERTVYMYVEAMDNDYEIISAVFTITQAGAPTYTVTYNANNGASPVPTYADGGHPAGPYTVLPNTNSNLGFTKTGHTFSKWNTSADGTGTDYDPADNDHNTIDLSGNVILYAQWTINTHNVNLPSNNFGTYGLSYTYNSETVTSPNNVPYGVEVTLTYTPASGYEDYTATWSVGNTTLSGNKFTMPDNDVTVTVAVSNRKTATYTIASTSSVTASGTPPTNSSATYSQTYNNQAGQMTSGNSMQLTLSGYHGQIIKGITLSMHSNAPGSGVKGAGYMSANAGTITLASFGSSSSPVNFNQWPGMTAYTNTYTDVVIPMTNSTYVIKSGETVEICIAATANSLYCESFTIEYEPSTDPIVNVTPASREVDYQAHNSTSENLDFVVSSENITSQNYTLVYCNASGTVLEPKPEEYDWFTPTLSGTTVSFTTAENTGGDRTAYFKVYATVDSEPVYSGLISVVQSHQLATYTLATSLEAGKRYIIASGNTGIVDVMSSKNGDVRSCVSANVASNQITEVDGLYEVVISGSGTSADPWTMFDVTYGGYLCSSNGTSAYLGTKTPNDAYGQWTISINNGAASIEANVNSDYRYLKYNPNTNSNNPRFACYKSTSTNMEDVYFFKKDDDSYNYLLDIAKHTENSGWNFIASPIAENVTANVYAGTAATDLYYYDEPSHTWMNYKNNHASDFTFANGVGYLYANSNNVTLTFTGTSLVSDDTKVIGPLSYTPTAGNLAGWNLVGNPFTSIAYVDRSYYVIGIDDETGKNIIVASEGGAIAPCTGVMVQAESTEDNVTFTTNAPANPSNGNLQMTVAHQATTRGGASATIDNAILSFNEGSQLGKFYFGENDANLYIQQNDKEYAILSAEGQGEMPVNFRANTDGQYTLTVNPEGVEMNYLHLIDNMTGNDIDLLQTPSYSFNAKTTDYESRFRLVFAANNESGVSAGSTTFAFYSNGNWMVNNEGEASLQVIDVMGRVLSNQTISGTAELSLNQQPGVYVLRLVNGNDVKTQKIVVR